MDLGEDEILQTCRTTIFSSGFDDYCPEYHEHLLKQYEGYVQTVWWLGELKQKVNSYFLTLNTILLAALGASFVNIPVASTFTNSGAMRVAIPFVALILCIVWFLIVYSYKQRSAIKLQIIRCIEEKLPLAPYTTESMMIRERFTGASYGIFRMSLTVPWIFAGLYIVIILFA